MQHIHYHTHIGTIRFLDKYFHKIPKGTKQVTCSYLQLVVGPLKFLARLVLLISDLDAHYNLNRL